MSKKRYVNAFSESQQYEEDRKKSSEVQNNLVREAEKVYDKQREVEDAKASGEINIIQLAKEKQEFQLNIWKDITFKQAALKLEDISKYEPANMVEQELYQNSVDGGNIDEYKQYKDNLTRLSKLNSKTFSGKAVMNKNIEEFYTNQSGKGSTLFGIKDKHTEIPIIGSFLSGIRSLEQTFTGIGVSALSDDKLSKDEKKELEELQEKVSAYEKPILERQLKELEAKYAEIRKKHNITDNKSFHQNTDEMTGLRTSYENAINKYKDKLEGKGFWGGFIDGKLGLLQIPDELRRANIISKIKEKGEDSLTDIEKDLLEAYEYEDIATYGIGQSSSYQLGETLRGSSEFIAETATSARLLKGGTTLLRRNLGTFGKHSAKLLDKTSLLTTPALMPSTYLQGMQDYNSQLQSYVDENGEVRYVASEKQKTNAVKNIRESLNVINSKASQLENKDNLTEEEATELAMLVQQKDMLNQGLNSIVDDAGKLRVPESSRLRSFAKGYQSNLTEVFAEKYVGKFLDNTFIPATGEIAAGMKLNKIVGPRIINIADKVNKTYREGLRRTDDFLFESNKLGQISKSLYTHVGPAKMIHSLPAEMAEELFVQAVPQLGEDYSRQLNEFANPDFYAQVAAATLIMGGTYSTLGGANHYKNMLNPAYKQSYKDTQQRLKNLKEQYRNIDNAVNDADLAQSIAMNTLGSIYSMNEYNSKIANLRNPDGYNPEGLSQEERNKQADILERNSFTNMAIQSFMTNTDKDFKRSLHSLSLNNKVSEDTRINAQKALQKIDKYKAFVNKSKDLINGDRVVDLEIRKDMLTDTISDMETEVANLASNTNLNSVFEKVNNTQEVTYSPSEIFQNIRNNEETEGINNFLAEIAKRDSNVNVNRFLEVLKATEDLVLTEQSLDTNLAFETDPRNYKAIKEREESLYRQAKVQEVTKDNADTVKQDLEDKGIADSKIVTDINEKAVDSTSIIVDETEDSVSELEFENILDPALIKALNNAVSTQTPNLNIEEEDFNQYAMSTANLEDANTQALIDKLSPIAKEAISKHSGMTFNTFIGSAIDPLVLGPDRVRQLFDTLRRAWEKGTGEVVSEQQTKELYDSLFLGDDISAKMKSVFSQQTVPKAEVASAKEIEVTDNAGETVKTDFNPVENRQVSQVEATPETRKRFHGVGLKLGGVLGIEYNRDSDTGEYTDLTDNINDTAKAFMDWRNFQPNDEVEIVFHVDYILENDGANIMSYWTNLDNELPTKHQTTFKERLSKMFSNVDTIGIVNGTKLNQEETWQNVKEQLEDLYNKINSNQSITNHPLFSYTNNKGLNVGLELLKILPTGVPNPDNKYSSSDSPILLGGINDYNWWNNGNVALFRNKNNTEEILYRERQERIKKNQSINLIARQTMLNNGGSMKVTVSSNTDAVNNIRKDVENFHSIWSNFNSPADLYNNITVGVFMDNEIVYYKSGSKSHPVKVGNNVITNPQSQITNWNEFLSNLDTTDKQGNKKFGNGRTVMVVRTGTDTFTVHNVINNHEALQDSFKKINADKVSLIANSILPNWLSTGREADVEKVQSWFEEHGLSRIDKQTIQDFARNYPTLVSSGNYKQDFNFLSAKGNPGPHARAFANANTESLIPDLRQYDSVDNFLEAILRGDNIPMIDSKELLLSNIHTNLKFTPIENKGETIYTYASQPKIMFDLKESDIIEEKLKEELNEANKKEIERLKVRKQIIQQNIAVSENENEVKSLSDDLNTINREITKLAIQKSAMEVADNINNAIKVIAVSGQEFTVNSSDILSYDTEVGPIRYILDRNRDMVMLRNTKAEIDNPLSAINSVVSEIVGRAVDSISLKTELNIPDFLNNIETILNDYISELRDKQNYKEADFIDNNKNKILGNRGNSEGSVREYISSILNITEIEDYLDQVGENVKEYDASSYEVDITQSLSGKIRLIFSNIKDTTQEPGFAGIYPNMSPSDVLDALHQLLSEVNNNSIEDIKAHISALVKRNPVDLKFYQDISDKLDFIAKNNPDILNQILYNLYQPRLKMKFAMWKRNSDGNMKLDAYNANVNDPLFVKRNEWIENLKSSSLIELYEQNYYRVNQQVFDKVKDLYATIKTNGYDTTTVNSIDKVAKSDLVNFLEYFGINLNDATLKVLFKEESENIFNNLPIDFNLETRLLRGKNSIVSQLMSNVEQAVKIEESNKNLPEDKKKKLSLGTVTSEGYSLNLLTSKNSQLLDLIHTDNFVEFQPMGVMRIAGKNIYMYQQPNNISNRVKNLQDSIKSYIDNPKEYKGLMQELRDTPITANSFLLDIIEENPEEALRSLDSFYISLESIKEAGSKSRDDMSITSLSDKDSFLTLFGMYLDSNGTFNKSVSSKFDNSISLRKGNISFPTMSDSSQLPFFETVLLDINNSNIVDGELSDSLLRIVKEKLLLSELNRVKDYITKVNFDSNIDGYDAGAIWITSIPMLNTVQIEADDIDLETGKVVGTIVRPLIEVFRRNVNNITAEDFINKHSLPINKALNEFFSNQADKLVTEDLISGQFVDFGLVDSKGKLTIDSKTIENKTARTVAFDYLVNYYIQQKEIQNLFAGDIAQYFKNKMVKDTVVDGQRVRQLKHGLPIVEFNDVVKFHYSSTDQRNRINSILAGIAPENLSAESKSILFEEFPELQYADEVITSDVSHEEAYRRLLPVASKKMIDMFKDVQNNLSKRLKGQISPGSQYSNVKMENDYIQIMISDVENSSETIENLIERNIEYKHLLDDTSFMNDLRRFKQLDEIYLKTGEVKTEHEKLLKTISNKIPNISAYLKTASTDAQEYTSWQENLNQLKSQGRISEDLRKLLEEKLLRQTEDIDKTGKVSPENKLTMEEMQMAIMQPTKPLYSGLVKSSVGAGHNVSRYVYVKSSSFPLLPELTQMFPKLDAMRKNIEFIQQENPGKMVRLSYQSANKVGAVKTPINVGELYRTRNDFETQEDYNNFISNIVEKSSVILSRDNFYIQQDKPFKSDKNAKSGKQDRTTRATQFEKIILGDGINKLGYVFNSSAFDASLLKDLGIESVEGKINGSNLKQIYNELYRREQKLRYENMLDRLGIADYSDISDGNVNAMRKIANLFNSRLNNKQDRKAMELLYLVRVPVGDNSVREEFVTEVELAERNLEPVRAMFRIPVHLTPNSKKIESVANSLINKNNINLDLPGFSSPVASQEGFDFRGYDEESYNRAKEAGLIVTENFDPFVGLKSERFEDGTLKFAQVFIANKFKVYNQQTGEYDYINLKDFLKEGTNLIDTSKLSEDLLSMFSFRIPTSSHQSGAVIEIAGFLPHNMGDLMIVPKDHTVQIGEDYDIDTRYVYQYNYIQDSNGRLKKVDYSDIQVPEQSLYELKQQFNSERDSLWNQYYENISNVDVNNPLSEGNFSTVIKNPYMEINKEKIMELVFLKDSLENYAVDKFLHALFQEQYEIDIVSKEFLKDRIQQLESEILSEDIIGEKKKQLQKEYREISDTLKTAYKDNSSALKKSWVAYNNAFKQKADEQKVIENNIVSIYKTVFSSPSEDVRSLITKVLSTDFAEDTVSALEEKSAKYDPNFSIYSPFLQRAIMKAGADGKLGIGVHSNAVTINSILQQLDDELSIYKEVEPGEIETYNIILGNNVFDGNLGRLYDKENKIRQSEYLMISQNSATDNQKLEIMSRRNENAETINVFSLLQLNGLELDGVSINNKELSYASLFIFQPIIQEYTALVKKYKSSTEDSTGNPESLAIKDLVNTYSKRIEEKNWVRDKNNKPVPGVFTQEAKDRIGRRATSKSLYDSINEDNTITDFELQYYILDTFIELKNASKELNKLQSFVNIENGGLGVSFFDTIKLKNDIKKIDEIKIGVVNPNSSKIQKSLFESMFGEMAVMDNSDTAGITELVEDNYIFISSENGLSTYVKPSNHYSHKIMTSTALGYNLWNSLFPYDNSFIKDIIEKIGYNSGVNLESRDGQDLKYSIISEMKEYSFSDSRTLFGLNVNKERENLFMDTDTNESLGSYLKKLKKSGSNLFKLPFFKDLKIEVNKNSYPTVIKYDSGDMSLENNIRIYNLLEELSKSNKKLPVYRNGIELTESELVKDIFKFSILADQGNGATGFRHLLPISLFSEYKVDASLRSKNNIKSDRQINVFYNGAKSSVESLLGSRFQADGSVVNTKQISKEKINELITLLNKHFKTDSNDVLFIYDETSDKVFFKTESDDVNNSNFVKQYFQHNPDKIKYKLQFGSKKLTDLLASNRATMKDVDDNTFNNFSVVSEGYKDGDEIKDYMVIVDSNGQRQLFERYRSNNIIKGDGVSNVSWYKRIPVLGVHGMNEYNPANPDIQSSLIANRNFNPTTSNSTVRQLESNYLNPDTIGNSRVEDVFQSLLANTYNNPYRGLMNMLSPFLTNMDYQDITIKVGDIKGDAMYTHSTKTITISSLFLREATVERLQNAMMEELLHFVTRTALDPYIKFTGIKNNKIAYVVTSGVSLPSEIQTLISVYNQALSHYYEKYGQEVFNKKVESWFTHTNNAENQSYLSYDKTEIAEASYRMLDMHEFLAGIFIKDSEFAKEMATAPYMKSGKNILEKFSEVLLRLFNRIIPGLKIDSVSANALNTLYTFLKKHHGTPNKKPATVKSLANNSSIEQAQKLIDDNKNLPEDNSYTMFTIEENDVSLENKSDCIF